MTANGVQTSDRDLRLDLFRGLANWAIFVDHVPNNAVAWITARNYGFSDAAELQRQTDDPVLEGVVAGAVGRGVAGARTRGA